LPEEFIGTGVPMAKFYKRNNFFDLRFEAFPTGWRKREVLGKRIFAWIPYKASSTVDFDIDVQWLEPTDENRSVLLTLVGNKSWRETLTLTRKNPSSKFIIRGQHEHDNGLLAYDLAWHDKTQVRVVRSTPISDNFWFAAIVTGLIAAAFTFVLPPIWNLIIWAVDYLR